MAETRVRPVHPAPDAAPAALDVEMVAFTSVVVDGELLTATVEVPAEPRTDRLPEGTHVVEVHAHTTGADGFSRV